jgi:hypothetical protein
MANLNLKLNGISYGRLPGYPNEAIGESYGVVDSLICNYSDRVSLANELLGYSADIYDPKTYDAGVSGMQILYALQVDINPQGGIDKSTGGYTYAVLTVKYGHLPTDELDEAGFEPTTEFLTLSSITKDENGNDISALFWDSGQTKPLSSEESPKFIVKRFALTFTKRYIFLPDWIYTHIGSVNSNTVRVLGKSYTAETLLCLDPTISRELSHNKKRWIVKPRFLHNPNGWNKVPRATADGDLVYVNIYDSTGAVKKLYPLKSFSIIT